MKRNIWGFPLFILAFAMLVVIARNAGVEKSNKQIEPESSANKTKVIEPDYTKGEIVFDKLNNRVCEELDLCWVTDGFLINGDRILKKQFIQKFGDGSALIIPRNEWDALSNQQKKDLTDYLKKRFISRVITGRVKPAEYSDGSINPSRNTITVDKTVWSSNN